MASNLPLDSRWRYLLDLSLHRLIFLIDPLNSLVFPVLLGVCNLWQKFVVWLIYLIFVLLWKLFVFIEKSIVHGLDEFVFVGFESALKGSGLFGEIAIQAVFGVFLHLVLRLRELYFDVISSTCHSVVHTHGMVQVGSVDHVFYVPVFIYPVVLLNHDFMKGVGEVVRSVVSLNLLV